MRYLIGLILLTFISGASFAQSKKVETLVIKTQINCDHCLKCESCGTRISDAVMGIAGVKQVIVNPDKNIIVVTYRKDKTSPDKIRKGISDIGYDADDVKASAAGLSKLDGCCKK